MIYVVALAFISNLFLGILVVTKKYQNKLYILFGFFSFTTALWVAMNVMTGITHSLFWLKSAYAFGALVPATGLVWLLYFLNGKISKKNLLLILLFGLFFFSVSYLDRYIITDVKEVYLGGFEGKIGFLYPVYAAYMFGILIFFVIKLAIEYKKSESIKRSQLGYLLIGSILFIFTSLTVSFFLPLFGIKRFIPLDSPSSLFFVACSAYAIVRHRLMDIRLVVKRTAVFVSTVIIVLLLALGLYWLEMTYFKEAIPPGVWGPIVLLIGLIIFDPLKKTLEKLANKYFFASIYSYQATLEKLAKELTHSIEIDQIIDSIVKTIRDTMKLDRTGVLLFDEQTSNYQVRQTIGFTIQNGISLVRNNFLTNFLLKKRQPVIYQELESLQSNGNGQNSDISKLKANMKRIEASLCLPLIINDKLIGIIVLGEKISRDAYTQEDLRLLESLSNQAAIALENARLYQQVQDFNKNLQVKVNQQTRDIKEKSLHLEKLLQMRSEFLNITSHQLRTPTSVLIGILEMAKSFFKPALA